MSTEYPNLPETFEAWTRSRPGEPEDLKRERLVLETPGDQEVIVARWPAAWGPYFAWRAHIVA
ncbi:hypothetical protein SAMN04487956_1458 [Halomonas saccharevitans]|uniref:Uncharacterized protein n=1 Tax=Halomonas saccharevitans TaxID=416872 RepID=A0A1I7CHK8_9GAMM|nr:hypothetical protein SAMN04487956_1458 [Halomonas saccharevitans]